MYKAVSRDSHLLQILETHAENLLSQRHTAAGLRGLVESQLASALPRGRVPSGGNRPTSQLERAVIQTAPR
jgi:hypothetical protein